MSYPVKCIASIPSFFAASTFLRLSSMKMHSDSSSPNLVVSSRKIAGSGTNQLWDLLYYDSKKLSKLRGDT